MYVDEHFAWDKMLPLETNFEFFCAFSRKIKRADGREKVKKSPHWKSNQSRNIVCHACRLCFVLPKTLKLYNA